MKASVMSKVTDQYLSYYPQGINFEALLNRKGGCVSVGECSYNVVIHKNKNTGRHPLGSSKSELYLTTSEFCDRYSEYWDNK